MTSTQRDPLDSGDAAQTERLAALLAEAGIDAAPGDTLVSVLTDLASLGAGAAPAPSPELAALLEASDRAARRRPASRRARIAIVTLTAAACLSGVGMAAAATTNEGFRHSIGHTFAVIVGTVTGARRELPRPADGAPGAPAPGASSTTIPPTTPGAPVWRTVPSGTPHNSSPAGTGAAPSQPGIIAQRTQGPTSTAPERTATPPSTLARPSEPGSASGAATSPARPNPTTTPHSPGTTAPTDPTRH